MNTEFTAPWLPVLVCAAVTFAAGPAFSHSDEVHAAAQAASSSELTPMASGQVKKIDRDAGKITIKHGPLENLGMPPMTMVFRVADPAMLDQVKVGDQIAFVAEKRNGALTVTKMEAGKGF